MAIEKSTPTTVPIYQPRLQPKPGSPRSFQSVLSATLGETQQGIPLPARLAPAQIPSSEVLGAVARLSGSKPAQIPSSEVRGAVARTVEAKPSPAPVPESTQFTPEEESVLRVWAKTVNAPAHHSRPAKAPSLNDPPSEVAAAVGADPEALAKTASAQIGRRYSVGGENPGRGFDCSGLTSYVFAKSGLELPRNSREQSKQGKPVPRTELRKGDLVFFGKKGVHHVGIYLEDGKFIHASSSRGVVRVSSLDEPVWEKLYAGARRVF